MKVRLISWLALGMLGLPCQAQLAATDYQANLTWDAPTGNTDPSPIAGYNVYRAIDGTDSYQSLTPGQLSTSVGQNTGGTEFSDMTVAQQTDYDYYVETVDSAGNSSAPSSVLVLPVPGAGQVSGLTASGSGNGG